MQEDYANILKDIEEAQECKENKNQYLANLKQQIQEQKEKISRADKNLQNAKKGIQKMFMNTGNKTLLIQEVCNLYKIFYRKNNVQLINLFLFIFLRKRYNYVNFRNKILLFYKTLQNLQSII